MNIQHMDGIGVFDMNKSTLCIFIDLARTFDTVSHYNLLKKSNRHGFGGKSFKKLLNRKVEYENHRSNIKIVEFGYSKEQYWALFPIFCFIC